MSDPLGKESTWKTFNSLLLVKNGKEKTLIHRLIERKIQGYFVRLLLPLLGFRTGAR